MCKVPEHYQARGNVPADLHESSGPKVSRMCSRDLDRGAEEPPLESVAPPSLAWAPEQLESQAPDVPEGLEEPLVEDDSSSDASEEPWLSELRDPIGERLGRAAVGKDVDEAARQDAG